MTLRPCPSCDRHVRVSEARCPFCSIALAVDAGPTTTLPGRLSRAAIFAFRTTAAAAALGACGTSAPPPPPSTAIAQPYGAPPTPEPPQPPPPPTTVVPSTSDVPASATTTTTSEHHHHHRDTEGLPDPLLGDPSTGTPVDPGVGPGTGGGGAQGYGGPPFEHGGSTGGTLE